MNLFRFTLYPNRFSGRYQRSVRLGRDLEQTTFFLTRMNSLATSKSSIALWRERIFVFHSRNSRRASSFFHIPAEQVVEIGVVVEI